jgi:hypothetical protein
MSSSVGGLETYLSSVSRPVPGDPRLAVLKVREEPASNPRRNRRLCPKRLNEQDINHVRGKKPHESRHSRKFNVE